MSIVPNLNKQEIPYQITYEIEGIPNEFKILKFVYLQWYLCTFYNCAVDKLKQINNTMFINKMDSKLGRLERTANYQNKTHACENEYF